MTTATNTAVWTAGTSFLPTTREQMHALGWEQPDVVFVSGDAYVDHPSFAAAILGRWLRHHDFKVAVLAQPDWQSADAWRQPGAPRLFYAVSTGASRGGSNWRWAHEPLPLDRRPRRAPAW